MTDDNEIYGEDIALAGEYALHLLDADERRAFEARMANEPVLRELLRDWDEKLVSLAAGFQEVPAPAHLKLRVERRLFGASRKAGSRYSLRAMFAGAFAAAAIAAVAFVVLPLVITGSGAPEYLAEIVSEDRALEVLASFDTDRNQLVVERLRGEALPGRALELWLIADGAPAPVSLGVLPADGVAEFTVPVELAAVFANGTLAISDEPEGGSPTGLPTGAVLALGAVTSI